MPSPSKSARPAPRKPLGPHLALALFVAVLAALAFVPLARAQQRPPEITILHSATGDPTATGLPLSVFFSLRDQNGEIVPRSALGLEGVQGELTVKPAGGQAFAPVPIEVGTPQTPIKIALVIDRSGSMNQLVSSGSGGEQRSLDAIVRDAAVESIKAAPDQAEFFVLSFAERPEEVSDGFLRKADQAQLVEDAIRRFTTNPAGTGNTCISDAALRAIEILNRDGGGQGPGAAIERKAVILFTDGLDREADGPNNPNNCSNADFSSVIRAAQQSAGTIIPIYTIWPCEPCDQNQQAGLVNLARETRGASAIGSLQDVNGLFQRVMELLNSQWVVSSDVLANQGDNTATLELRLDGGGVLTAATPFLSPVTISPRPTVEVAQQQYLPDEDRYRVTLGIGNPAGVGQIVAGVYNLETGGTLIGQEQRFDEPGARIDFDLPTEGLRAGDTYYLRISGTDKGGQSLSTADGQTLRIVYPFVYEPRLNYNIGAVTPEWEEERLTVAVEARGAGQRELSFSGEIVDRANGNKEALELTTLRDGQLRFPLPAMLREATQASEYEVVLRLEDGENMLERRTDPAVTIVPPPPPPAPILPIALGLLGIALVGALGGYFYMRSRAPKREIPLPFNPQTRIGIPPPDPQAAKAAAEGAQAPTGPAAPQKSPPAPVKVPSPARQIPPPDAALTEIRSAKGPAAPSVPTALAGATVAHNSSEPTVLHQPSKPRARIKVLRTVEASQARETSLELPCVIGREGVDFVITGDIKISRRHAELRLEGQQLLLIDLGSMNGSTVRDRPVPKNGSAPLEGPTVIGIGPNTSLEVELV